MYYGTSATGTLAGYTVTANTAFRITASAGQVIYYYYTYSVPEGGEKNTMNNRNSFTVGNCSSLKSEEETAIAEADVNSFVAFPVPMTDELNLKFTENQFTEVSITDISGKIVLKQIISSNTSSLVIVVSQLKKGAYLLTLQGLGNKTGKLIIK